MIMTEEAPAVIEPGSLPLEYGPWEKFAQAVVKQHLSYIEAYHKCIETRKKATDEYDYQHASHVACQSEVKARIEFLRIARGTKIIDALGTDGLYLARKHQRIIETPIGEITEDHPLCQEWQHDHAGTEEGPIVKMRVKMPSKMDALKALADLIGANAPVRSQVESTGKIEVTSDDMLRPENLPGMHAFGVHLRTYPDAARELLNGLEGRDFGDGKETTEPV